MNGKELERLWSEGDAPERYARLLCDGKAVWTRWRGPDKVVALSDAPWRAPVDVGPMALQSLETSRFLAPAEPTKIVGLALNFKSLVGSMESYPDPLVFLKGLNSLAGYEESIAVPPPENRSWQEVELAMVMGARAKNVSVEQAAECIFGFTVANDVSTTNLAERDHHLAQSKSRDGFCPCGPFLSPGVDTANLEISSFIDGQRKQLGATGDRLLTDSEAIAYISRFMTLEPGDLVLTGTCAGWLETTLVPGCEMEVRIETLGSLRNTARLDQSEG